MNDTVNGRVLGKDLVDGLLVRDIDLVEGRSTTADQLDTV